MLKVIFLLISFSSCLHAAESVMQIIPLVNRPAEEIQPLVTPFLENSERIIANHSNLIVRASPKRLHELKRLIKQLDTRLQNLTITVLQSRTKTARQLNASANIRLHIPTHQPSKLSGHIGGRFAQTEGIKNKETRQLIRTLDGQSATIRTGTIHPVQNVSIIDSGLGRHAITSHRQYIEATTGFVVTPRLTGHQVTLQIKPWSDHLTNNGTFDTQEATTSLQVNLGQWVEIGGINEQSQYRKNSTLSHTYSTRNNTLRILIKVEKSL